MIALPFGKPQVQIWMIYFFRGPYLAIARQKCRLSLPFLLDALALLEIRADSFFQLVAEDLDKRLSRLQDPLIREFESTPPTPLSTIFVDYTSGERVLNLEISGKQLAKAEPKEILKDISTNLTSLSRIDRIKALLIASKCFRWIDDHSKALVCLNAVRGLVGKDFRLLPPAMTEYGYICGEHFGDLQSAVSWSDKFALLATIHDDDTSALRALIAGGTFSSLQGNFLMARARVTKDLDYCESQSFLQMTCFHSMAVISLKLDRTDEAKDWLEKATPLLSENGGKNFSKALWLMGELEARTGHLRSAIVTLDQAFATMELISSVDSALILIDILRVSVGSSYKNLTEDFPDRITRCASRLPKSNVIGRAALLDLATLVTRGERLERITLDQAKRSISRSPRSKRFSD